MGFADKRSSGLLDDLLASGPELEHTDWALEWPALERVVAEIARGREQIVECGSGVSTVVIARLLRRRGRGRLTALEHDRHWAALTGERIAAEGLGDHALVVEAPLRPEPLAQPGCEWYDRAGLAELPGSGIDLLLVDGPPAPPGAELERSRYPALPLLAERLAPGAIVILDDAGREGERWVIERWRRELGMRLERAQGGRIAIGVCSGQRVQEAARTSE